MVIFPSFINLVLISLSSFSGKPDEHVTEELNLLEKTFKYVKTRHYTAMHAYARMVSCFKPRLTSKLPWFDNNFSIF